MSSAEVFDVVSQHLTALWSATPLVFENEDWAKPDTPAPFVLVELFGDFFDQQSIGGGPQVTDNLWREGGVLLMHVMTPNNTGTREARVLAKQLVDLFRGQEIGGVVFRDATVGAGDKGEEDGNYFRMTASVTWQRDE
jgi:hypothetical protein